MRAFYFAYCGEPIVAQPVRQSAKTKKVAQRVRQSEQPAAEESPPASIAALPWGHNILILQKIKDFEQRRWHATKALGHRIMHFAEGLPASPREFSLWRSAVETTTADPLFS